MYNPNSGGASSGSRSVAVWPQREQKEHSDKLSPWHHTEKVTEGRAVHDQNNPAGVPPLFTLWQTLLFVFCLWPKERIRQMSGRRGVGDGYGGDHVTWEGPNRGSITDGDARSTHHLSVSFISTETTWCSYVKILHIFTKLETKTREGGPIGSRYFRWQNSLECRMTDSPLIAMTSSNPPKKGLKVRVQANGTLLGIKGNHTAIIRQWELKKKAPTCFCVISWCFQAGKILVSHHFLTIFLGRSSWESG